MPVLWWEAERKVGLTRRHIDTKLGGATDPPRRNHIYCETTLFFKCTLVLHHPTPPSFKAFQTDICLFSKEDSLTPRLLMYRDEDGDKMLYVNDNSV
jgi:hypothetical protein